MDIIEITEAPKNSDSTSVVTNVPTQVTSVPNTVTNVPTQVTGVTNVPNTVTGVPWRILSDWETIPKKVIPQKSESQQR